ncbi:bifunctional epoxide hydrolase 2-like protein [Tanacetum coccineum]|uniref:Bifunctional epoxide hydrolase 2-like protein n=1 Tax=Tanacetum coccineum TaxID=301880 RepID=A0ABQ4X1X3_9ASTR
MQDVGDGEDPWGFDSAVGKRKCGADSVPVASLFMLEAYRSVVPPALLMLDSRLSVDIENSGCSALPTLPFYFFFRDMLHLCVVGGDRTGIRELALLGTTSPSVRFSLVSSLNLIINQALIAAGWGPVKLIMLSIVRELEVSSADLREKLEMYEGLLKQLEEYQDNLMRPLRTRLAEIDADFTRCLTDLEAYIPSAEDDFNSVIRELRDLNLSLLQESLNRRWGCLVLGMLYGFFSNLDVVVDYLETLGVSFMDTDLQPDGKLYCVHLMIFITGALIEPPAEVPATNVLSTVVIVLRPFAWRVFLQRSDSIGGIVSFSQQSSSGDIVGLLDHLGLDKVFVVGHDWGSMIAWCFCLLRPDRVKALVNMSVVFSPRNPVKKPIESMRKNFGSDYYIFRFQEPGVLEAEFARVDTALLIKKFLTSRNPGLLCVLKEVGFGGNPNSKITLPSWFSEDDVNYFASKFRRTGFTGGLNYYRAMDLNWELTAAWTGEQIKLPVKFIVGDLDLTYNTPGVKDFIHKGGLSKHVPFLQELVIMEGVAHYINQERPQEISEHIYDFIKKF